MSKMNAYKKQRYVIEFDTIPHDALMKCLKKRIADRPVLTLIRMWLEAPVSETDDRGRTTLTRPTQGTPQGGVISPLLANLSLHWFEKLFVRRDGSGVWANAKLVRYADDFVVLARNQSRRLVNWIEGTLEGRFRLTINREKTRIVPMQTPGESLNFLGFTLRYDRDRHGRDRRHLNVVPSEKAQARARDKLREMTGPSQCHRPVPDVIQDVNRFLGGWGNYFRHGDPAAAFHKLNGFVASRLTRHLQRRSQRPFRPPKEETYYAHLQRLGLRLLKASRCRLAVHALRPMGSE
jgi:RNA-directed DNA polymerase